MKFETWERKCQEWEKQHPGLPLPSSLRFHYEDKYTSFVDRLETTLERAESYGVANISTLPKVHYDRAMKVLIRHTAYWLSQLKQIGGQEFIDRLIEKVKVE